MRPRFLLDEHLRPQIAEAANRAGMDVLCVSGTELEGRDDLSVFRAAIAEGRILVTYNSRDFIPLLKDLIRHGQSIPGLVTISARTVRSDVVRGLARLLRRLAGRIERGEVDPSTGTALTR